MSGVEQKGQPRPGKVCRWAKRAAAALCAAALLATPKSAPGFSVRAYMQKDSAINQDLVKKHEILPYGEFLRRYREVFGDGAQDMTRQEFQDKFLNLVEDFLKDGWKGMLTPAGLAGGYREISEYFREAVNELALPGMIEKWLENGFALDDKGHLAYVNIVSDFPMAARWMPGSGTARAMAGFAKKFLKGRALAARFGPAKVEYYGNHLDRWTTSAIVQVSGEGLGHETRNSLRPAYEGELLQEYIEKLRWVLKSNRGWARRLSLIDNAKLRPMLSENTREVRSRTFLGMTFLWDATIWHHDPGSRRATDVKFKVKLGSWTFGLPSMPLMWKKREGKPTFFGYIMEWFKVLSPFEHWSFKKKLKQHVKDELARAEMQLAEQRGRKLGEEQATPQSSGQQPGSQEPEEVKRHLPARRSANASRYSDRRRGWTRRRTGRSQSP